MIPLVHLPFSLSPARQALVPSLHVVGEGEDLNVHVHVRKSIDAQDVDTTAVHADLDTIEIGAPTSLAFAVASASALAEVVKWLWYPDSGPCVIMAPRLIRSPPAEHRRYSDGGGQLHYSFRWFTVKQLYRQNVLSRLSPDEPFHTNHLRTAPTSPSSYPTRGDASAT
jgi:hypothetical protein